MRFTYMFLGLIVFVVGPAQAQKLSSTELIKQIADRFGKHGTLFSLHRTNNDVWDKSGIPTLIDMASEEQERLEALADLSQLYEGMQDARDKKLVAAVMLHRVHYMKDMVKVGLTRIDTFIIPYFKDREQTITVEINRMKDDLVEESALLDTVQKALETS